MASKDVQVVSILHHFHEVAEPEQMSTGLTEDDAKMPDPEDSPEDPDDLKEMQDFKDQLAMYAPVKAGLQRVDEVTHELREARAKMQRVTEEKERAAIVGSVDKLLKVARKAMLQVRKKLLGPGGAKEALEASNGTAVQGSVDAQVRENLFNSYLSQFVQKQKEYLRLAQLFKDTVNKRTKRDLLAVDAQMTDEKANELIDQGAAQEYLTSVMDGSNPQFEEVMARAEAVKNIKSQVAELLGMFLEMQALVQQQQETVDNICAHVENAKGYTGEAAVTFEEAADYKLTADKQKLICAIIAGIVVTGIALLIYFLVK